MHKVYISVILIITLLFSCLSLSGCGKVEEEYRTFYDSLVDKKGNFRFRGTNPGDSQDSILQAEGLSGTIDEDVSGMDSTGLFRCRIPVQFPCFSFDLYRDYRTPLHTPSTVDDFRYNSSMTSGSYTAFFEQQEEFAAACGQITAFLKEYFPKGSSFEALEHIPEPERRILTPQWQTEAKDGSQLLVTFQNKVSSQVAKTFCFIRIEVSYRKLQELVTEDYQEFYQALVNPEGNFRFRGTEPGQTREELISNLEKEGYGENPFWLSDDTIRSKALDLFPCFSFFFFKVYWMKQSARLVNGKAESHTENALKSGYYQAAFSREEDWAEACRQITNFLKATFSEGTSFEALEQLPEPDEVMSPQWSMKAPDGSRLDVTFQNKGVPEQPKTPSACFISVSIMY